jgi:hypothetical protein
VEFFPLMDNLFRASQVRNEAEPVFPTMSMESAFTMSLKAQPHSSKRLFRCTNSNCKKTFLYQSELNRHIQTHSNSRPFACTFPGCSKGFKRQDTLQTHFRLHTGEKPFVCEYPLCGMSFSTKAALRYHSLKHASDKIFQCDVPECGKSFLTLGQLKQHEKGKCHCARAVFFDGHSSYSTILTKNTSIQQEAFQNEPTNLTLMKSGPVSTAYSDDGSEPDIVKRVRMILDESIFLS